MVSITNTPLPRPRLELLQRTSARFTVDRRANGGLGTTYDTSESQRRQQAKATLR